MSEFYDLRILKGSRTRIVLDNGKLEEISEAPFQGAAVRALSGGAWGFVTTDAVEGLEDKIELAKRIARKIDRHEDLRLAEAPAGKSVNVPVKKNPRDLSLEEKVELLKEIENAAKVKGVSSTQAVYSEVELTTGYRSSEGLDLESEMTRMENEKSHMDTELWDSIHKKAAAVMSEWPDGISSSGMTQVVLGRLTPDLEFRVDSVLGDSKRSWSVEYSGSSYKIARN